MTLLALYERELFYRRVLLSFTHAFSEQIFYLPVDGSEVILRPCRYFIIQRGGKPQRYLFLYLVLVVRRLCQNETLLLID